MFTEGDLGEGILQEYCGGDGSANTQSETGYSVWIRSYVIDITNKAWGGMEMRVTVMRGGKGAVT